MYTFYFKDNNKSSRLINKESNQLKFLNFIVKTMFPSFEINQTRSQNKYYSKGKISNSFWTRFYYSTYDLVWFFSNEWNIVLTIKIK